MSKLIICVGLPASGKSFWARKMVETDPEHYVRVNYDDLRIMLVGEKNLWRRTKTNEAVEPIVVAASKMLVTELLSQHFNVIVDNTNLSEKTQSMWNRFAFKHSDEFEIKDFRDISLATCLERDAKRTPSVGARVVREMYDRYIKPTYQVIQHNDALSNCIIVDLDGVLADFSQTRGSYEWDKIHLDKVNQSILEMVNLYKKDHKIIIITSRDKGICEGPTLKWLKDNKISYDEIYFRSDESRKKNISSDLVKKDLYTRFVEPRFNVTLVLEDYEPNVFMFRKLGLTVFKVC